MLFRSTIKSMLEEQVHYVDMQRLISAVAGAVLCEDVALFAYLDYYRANGAEAAFKLVEDCARPAYSGLCGVTFMNDKPQYPAFMTTQHEAALLMLLFAVDNSNTLVRYRLWKGHDCFLVKAYTLPASGTVHFLNVGWKKEQGLPIPEFAIEDKQGSGQCSC